MADTPTRSGPMLDGGKFSTGSLHAGELVETIVTPCSPNAKSRRLQLQVDSLALENEELRSANAKLQADLESSEALLRRVLQDYNAETQRLQLELQKARSFDYSDEESPPVSIAGSCKMGPSTPRPVRENQEVPEVEGPRLPDQPPQPTSRSLLLSPPPATQAINLPAALTNAPAVSPQAMAGPRTFGVLQPAQSQATFQARPAGFFMPMPAGRPEYRQAVLPPYRHAGAVAFGSHVAPPQVALAPIHCAAPTYLQSAAAWPAPHSFCWPASSFARFTQPTPMLITPAPHSFSRHAPTFVPFTQTTPVPVTHPFSWPQPR